MKYEDVKNPKQLLEYIDENIKYGFVDDSGKEYTPWNNEEFQEACKSKWKLSTPDRLIKLKYGHCWDTIELERDWFKKNGYSFKTFYIWFEFPYDNSYSTHTYLVFESDGKYYYFESANFNNRGIYEFSSYEEAINYQKAKHIDSNKHRNPVGEEELKHIHIYEYDKPIYGCTMNEFINNILSNAKEINVMKKEF